MKIVRWNSVYLLMLFLVFFFQAEDGIRDIGVTGVQTCALPIYGQSKINAAYALGGPALAIETVESYLDVQINHLVEVNFENFPALIDSLGGVTVKDRKSVVEGKSVDLGGRRIIQKKNTQCPTVY